MKYRFNKIFSLKKKMLENLILAPIWARQTLIWATKMFLVFQVY